MGLTVFVTRAPLRAACWETANGLCLRELGSILVRVFFAVLRPTIWVETWSELAIDHVVDHLAQIPWHSPADDKTIDRISWTPVHQRLNVVHSPVG